MTDCKRKLFPPLGLFLCLLFFGMTMAACGKGHERAAKRAIGLDKSSDKVKAQKTGNIEHWHGFYGGGINSYSVGISLDPEGSPSCIEPFADQEVLAMITCLGDSTSPIFLHADQFYQSCWPERTRKEPTRPIEDPPCKNYDLWRYTFDPYLMFRLD